MIFKDYKKFIDSLRETLFDICRLFDVNFYVLPINQEIHQEAENLIEFLTNEQTNVLFKVIPGSVLQILMKKNQLIEILHQVDKDLRIKNA